MPKWMMCSLAWLAMSLGPVGGASADQEGRDELWTAIYRCRPSCYETIKYEGPADKIKICAYRPIFFEQQRIGRRWGKLDSSPANPPVLLKDCVFPRKVPKKWKKIVAEAKRQLRAGKGDFVTIAPDTDDWSLVRNDLGVVTGRGVWIHHYSRGHEDFDRCRAGDPSAVCELDNRDTRTFNQVSYRVAEARTLLKAGKQKECRHAAWDAVSQANLLRTGRELEKKRGRWKPDLTYATRYDGILTEKELFARNDELEKEARGLFRGCGGPAAMPFAAHDLQAR